MEMTAMDTNHRETGKPAHFFFARRTIPLISPQRVGYGWLSTAFGAGVAVCAAMIGFHSRARVPGLSNDKLEFKRLQRLRFGGNH